MLRIVNKIQSTGRYVPLKQMNIESTICSFAADVTITQIFRNRAKTSVVAVYSFPIEEQVAIYRFTARIDNREIVAQLREKAETHTEHANDSGQNGDTYFLEGDERSQGNFIIDVGTLPAAKECVITISYVTELDLIQGSIIRFVIPAAIAPQQNPHRKGLLASLNTTSRYVQCNPYTIDFACRIKKIRGPNQEPYIAELTSPSHRVEMDPSLPDVYLASFVQNDSYLDRDIVLDIKLSEKRANTFVVIESGAAMAAVTPFEEDCCLTSGSDPTNEFIFIVDCSSSMRNENKNGLAREAMLFFLKNLPNSCYFNMIKFGAKYSCLFNESVAFYNHINMRTAEKFISRVRADLGGTELLGPLQWLQQHPPGQGRARQIFLLTDGQVPHLSEVLELCRSMAPSTRIFSFGLGAAPSRSLVKGLARITNGRFVFIPPDTSVEAYIGEQLQQATRRCFTDIRLEWNLGVPVESVPDQLPPTYLDDRSIFYALADRPPVPLTTKSFIEIRTDQSYYRLNITASDRITSGNKMIERLAAKALILQLEHSNIPQIGRKKVRFEQTDEDDASDSIAEQIARTKQQRKQRIIDLSLQYNILSSYTTFIGIEKRLADKDADTLLREIPIEISINDQRSRSRHADKVESDAQYPDASECTAATTTDHFPTSSDSHPVRDYPSQTRAFLGNRDETNPMIDAKNAVYFLLQKQAADGLWYFVSSSKVIEDLTGKPLAAFPTSETPRSTPMLVTAIIIILLESEFSALRSIWEEMAERARQRLICLLNNDWKSLVTLFRDIRVVLTK